MSYKSDDSSYSSTSSEEMVDIFLGETLNNRYLLIHKIGSGACSTVWLSLDMNLKKYIAIKIQNPEDFDDGIEEVELLKKISKSKCEYINSVLDSFIHYDREEDEKYICMVFELMAGSVYDIVRVGKYSKGLPVEIVIKITFQLLTAMNVINQNHNILHTDIKPENILFVGTNNKDKEIIEKFENNNEIQKILQKKKKGKDNRITEKKNNLKKAVKSISFDEIEEKYDKYTYSDVKDIEKIEMFNDIYINNIVTKLSDFGLCRKLNYSNFDIQTRHYRAPEIILGYDFDERCDLWSVGCLFYELLTGQVLFDPQKSDGLNTSRQHIYDMVCLFGKIPESIINSSVNKNNFFKKNGLLKGITKVDFHYFYDSLELRLQEKGIEEPRRLEIKMFLSKIFQYNPQERAKIKDLIQHPIFPKIS